MKNPKCPCCHTEMYLNRHLLNGKYRLECRNYLCDEQPHTKWCKTEEEAHTKWAMQFDGAVVFLDYDGSLIECWEYDDVASKTSLPDNPVHDGLIAIGWNWGLAYIKDYVDRHPGMPLVVGQVYTTASGQTEYIYEKGDNHE